MAAIRPASSSSARVRIGERLPVVISALALARETAEMLHTYTQAR